MTDGIDPQASNGQVPVDGAPPAPVDHAAHGGTDPLGTHPGASGEGLGADPPAVVDPADASLLGLIDRLATLLERSELTELEVHVGGTGLVLRKPAAIAPAVMVAAGMATGAASAATASGTPAAHGGDGAPAEGAARDAAHAARPSVKAPLTGIWYASPSPGSAPFVEVGGEVASGQVIGLIEAMKLFNEIKSDLSGKVVKVHAENGKLVKAKQPLIEVEPY